VYLTPFPRSATPSRGKPSWTPRTIAAKSQSNPSLPPSLTPTRLRALCGRAQLTVAARMNDELANDIRAGQSRWAVAGRSKRERRCRRGEGRTRRKGEGGVSCLAGQAGTQYFEVLSDKQASRNLVRHPHSVTGQSRWGSVGKTAKRDTNRNFYSPMLRLRHSRCLLAPGQPAKGKETLRTPCSGG